MSMADRELARLLHQIRKTAGTGGLSDAQLLERVVASGDEAAFELLVWRHEPLVFGLCRRGFAPLPPRPGPLSGPLFSPAPPTPPPSPPARPSPWFFPA